MNLFSNHQNWEHIGKLEWQLISHLSATPALGFLPSKKKKKKVYKATTQALKDVVTGT